MNLINPPTERLQRMLFQWIRAVFEYLCAGRQESEGITALHSVLQKQRQHRSRQNEKLSVHSSAKHDLRQRKDGRVALEYALDFSLAVKADRYAS